MYHRYPRFLRHPREVSKLSSCSPPRLLPEAATGWLFAKSNSLFSWKAKLADRLSSRDRAGLNAFSTIDQTDLPRIALLARLIDFGTGLEQAVTASDARCPVLRTHREKAGHHHLLHLRSRPRYLRCA